MKIFFDLEFTGLHQNTSPVSIGCISEDGRSFYAEFSDYDKTQLDEWLKENVIKHLSYAEPIKGEREHFSITRSEHNPVGNDLYDGFSLSMRGDKVEIKEALTLWLEHFKQTLTLWGDCLAYDWVLFCELFGGAMEIPECVYYIPFDLSTVLQIYKQDPDISREKLALGGYYEGMPKHNSLWDATIIKKAYEVLTNK